MKKFISTILALVIVLSMITIVQAADFSGNGYNFVCADGGRYLNVYAGKDADGTNVCVWERDGSPEQNYTISACGGGKYKLYPACSSSRVIDVNRGNSYNNPLKAGLNVDLWRTNDAPAQEFYITHVGNNLYKIELAALSGHVLQANNPNKNNGNVTLERYTGASNQHWKILKNGTQVTEPCTHKNISNKNEKTTITQKDTTAHTVTTSYDKVCNDCGKTVESNVKETKIEKHTMVNNKCKSCVYEAPVIEEKPVESTPIEEPTVCKHEKTYTSENSVTYGSPDKNLKVKDDEYHIGYYYADEYCSKCKVLVNKKVIVEKEELHTYWNGVCTSCLHQHHTEKPEETELRINKTTFTPGEKIELQWPFANRASSYDIHIYKEGMSSRYRLDSGFTDNSASIVINDEGVFDLSIYSINNQGYTRGNNIKITVKSPYAEKTAYVYNTDGDNLNMRSQANSSSTIVSKIPAGATLTVTGDAINGFYPVKHNGKTGYASTAYITFTKPSVNKTAYVYNTDGANLNMRSSANKNASIVTKMPEGSTLTVTGDATNGFYPVKYGNYSGYASTSYITFTKPSTSTTITSTNTSYVWPSSGGYLIYVLDYYYGSTRGGAHPTKGGGAIKGAIDIATTGNALATATGTIIEAKYGYNSGWGNYITIKHDDGTYSFYAHLSKINVSVNQRVTAGQTIGVIGTTGNSTGVHLHFEIWDSSQKTIYTIDAFKEKYKKQLVYDGDIVTGGSNSGAIKSWVQNNYKMSGGRWYAK